MNKLTIQKSKFDDEKNKIKAFAKNLPSEIALPCVDTDGALWGLFDHRVTGAELNQLSKQIQNNLIAVKGGVPGARGGLVIIREAIKVKRPKMQ